VLQHVEVLIGQGRAAGGNRTRHARAEQPDHVGVALAHDDLAGLHHVALGPVEAVQRAPLRVDRRLLRDLVLGPVSLELAATEGRRWWYQSTAFSMASSKFPRRCRSFDAASLS